MARRAVKPLHLLALALGLTLASAWPCRAASAPVECWQGWGYRIDPQTRTYTSPEMLLATKGPADWQPGHEVTLYILDRASGRIDARQPPIIVAPFNPRTYYRDNLNYVDGEGDIAGSDDNLVFGLSHVPLPTAAIEKMYEYNRWACGLEGSVG
jgi:hypothetical protein